MTDLLRISPDLASGEISVSCFRVQPPEGIVYIPSGDLGHLSQRTVGRTRRALQVQDAVGRIGIGRTDAAFVGVVEVPQER